jgi:predicted PurR-regulated permease PerM
MKIIITESQSKILITENVLREIGSFFKISMKNIKDIINSASEQIGMNLQFMMTWGAGIAGFIGPITEYVKGEFPDLNDVELSLIITSLIATYYTSNKKALTKLYKKIEEEGLGKYFEKILRKTDEFYNVFSEFIKSLATTTHTMVNMMSYTFIIPILPMLYESIKSGMFENVDLDEIVTMLTGFGGLTITSILIKKLLTKLAERFKK